MTDIRPRLRRLAPLLGPVLVVLAVFPEALFGGRVFFDRDIGAYWLPHAATFVRILAQGSWPLWNPYEGFGLPLLADPSVQVAYPTTWLNVVLAPPTVYKVLLLGHAVLAGAGVVALGRRWGMSGLAASLAGTAWCASGPFLSAGSLHQHFCGAAWIAWVLLALESALADPGRRAAARLGAVAAVEALTGSADMCLLTAVAAVGRIAFWLAADSRAGRPAARIHFARVTTLAGAAALAFALAAIQWIPSASLLKSVERGRLGPGEILYWSVHPLSLIDLFVPRFFADLPLSLDLRAALFEGREPFLVSLYVGLASLGLVILVRPRGWEPRSYAAAMVVLFGLAALGRHVFLLPLLLTTPPFSLSRYPAKYTLPFAMFWSLLAGFGLDAWRRQWDAGERRRGVAALAIMAALAVAGGAGDLWVQGDGHAPASHPPRVPRRGVLPARRQAGSNRAGRFGGRRPPRSPASPRGPPAAARARHGRAGRGGPGHRRPRRQPRGSSGAARAPAQDARPDRRRRRRSSPAVARLRAGVVERALRARSGRLGPRGELGAGDAGHPGRADRRALGHPRQLRQRCHRPGDPQLPLHDRRPVAQPVDAGGAEAAPDGQCGLRGRRPGGGYWWPDRGGTGRDDLRPAGPRDEGGRPASPRVGRRGLAACGLAGRGLAGDRRA